MEHEAIVGSTKSSRARNVCEEEKCDARPCRATGERSMSWLANGRVKRPLIRSSKEKDIIQVSGREGGRGTRCHRQKRQIERGPKRARREEMRCSAVQGSRRAEHVVLVNGFAGKSRGVAPAKNPRWRVEKKI